ncbi:DUF58 domain-containing protein [Rhodopirellula sp. JC740]|uniref:DUF58 domain-containing protein n=2 Tax=Rhodopirellula halodulae TaxID=2894198 RepID=A0ABS8NKP7_9BACT|nr:DUF58 domain-containing protein [Rhodopirellula sp. JC740]
MRSVRVRLRVQYHNESSCWIGCIKMGFGNQIQALFQSASQWPWLLLVLISFPLVFLAFWLRLYPTKRWVALLMTSMVLSIAVVFVPAFLVVLALVDGIIFTVTAIDGILHLVGTRAIGKSGLQVERNLSRTGSLGVPLDSVLILRNITRSRIKGLIRDDLPDYFVSKPIQHQLDLPAGLQLQLKRKLTPHRRGAFSLERVDLKLISPLGLWQRHISLALESPLKIFPDMKQLSDYALLARTNRLSLIGVRRTRRIGQDSDFERLRDYTRDDNYRHIDWRSTARRNKLTVRQFQSDQSQRLIFLLDCGRMMTNTRNGYSLLDHALNSILMMSYVALHQGDSVGMICFSDTIHAYLPPRGGASQMNRLLQAGFDQFPRMVESRYDQAFLYLNSHCKKRSLVTLTTNIIDEVNAEVISDQLSNLTGTHLPLAVVLRDREIFDAADEPMHVQQQKTQTRSPQTIDETSLYRAGAAAEMLVWREEVLRGLRHKGVLIVDAFPDELSAPLVNQYLEVKAKHLL